MELSQLDQLVKAEVGGQYMLTDNLLIANNKWGADENFISTQEYSQVIYSNPYNRFPDVPILGGVKWEVSDKIPDIYRKTVLGFPSIIWGRHALFEQTTSLLALKRIDAYKKLDVTVSYLCETTGSCNVALDIWFVRQGNPRPLLELMIWLKTPKDQQPAGVDVESISVGSTKYRYWVEVPDRAAKYWGVCTLVREVEPFESWKPNKIDILEVLQASKKYIDFLGQRLLWSEKFPMVLASIEFGSEVYAVPGSGSAAFNFQVDAELNIESLPGPTP